MAIIDDLKFANIDACYENNTAAKAPMTLKLRLSNGVKFLVNYWKSRKHLNQLRNLSDEALADIGLNYSDVEQLRTSPWHLEAGERLEDARYNNIHQARMTALARLRQN